MISEADFSMNTALLNRSSRVRLEVVSGFCWQTKTMTAQQLIDPSCFDGLGFCNLLA